VKCEFCGKEEPLPFVCNYCGGAFCADHRLPEAHQCKGDLTQKRMLTAPPQTTFSWQSTPFPEQAPVRVQGKVFSRIEIRDIIVAWVALGVAFSFALAGGGLSLLTTPGFTLFDALILLGISLITVGAGFVFHELSHKFVAQRYGYWAEFRMWPFGLVLALVTSMIGLIFAAPGATYISGTNISTSQNGRISLAGPLTNVVISALFLPFLLFGGSGILYEVGYIGVRINIFLAVFNMLPLGPLDGSKVFRWSLPVWIAVFVPLALALYLVYFR
jgi:Zn-dependent protease